MNTEPFLAADQSPTPGEPGDRRTLPPLGSDPEIRASTPPIILEGQAAFFADLPEMLRDRYKQWVAYHGKHCIGFGKTKTALYKECRRQGCPMDEIIIYCVWPYPEVDYISAV